MLGLSRRLWPSLLALTVLTHAQTDVDRLESKLELASGRDRIEILIEFGGLLTPRDAARSLALGKEALQLAEEMGDASSRARALALLGRAGAALNRFEDAVRHFQEGVQIAEAAGLTAELVRLLHGLGVVYAILGRTDEGLRLSLRALTLAESIGDQAGRSRALGEAGVIQMMRHEYDSAWDLMTRALEAKRLYEDSSAVAGALSNLGVISRNLKRYPEALGYLEEALEIQVHLGETLAEGSTLSRIGRVYGDLGDSDRALEYHLRALPLLEEAEARRAVVATLLDIRDIYRAGGDLERALHFFDRYLEERDAVFDQASRGRIEELQTRFEVQQREREYEYLRRVNRLQLHGFLAVFALAAMVVFLVVLRHRQSVSAISLDLARRKMRDALHEMKSVEDWPRFLSTLRSELGRILPGLAGFRILRSESREGRIVLREVEPADDGPDLTELPEPVRAAVESGAPVFLESSLAPSEIWSGEGAALIGSTAVIPLHRGLLLAAGRKKSVLRQVHRRTLLEMAQLISAALTRLEDFRTLSARETQLRQARQMESIGNLTGGIAHHFNNLMQTILGNLELARRLGAADVQPFLIEIDEAGRRASGLVRRLLRFSKRAPSPARGEVDLAQVVKEAVASAEGGVPITLDIRAEARVRGDEAQLREIPEHLLANARDAVEGLPDPEVGVTLDWAGSAQTNESGNGGEIVRLEVRDNGRGIDPDIRDRVFDPFFTTRPADREGLGLSTVLYLTERHGGWVELRSAPGLGTTVEIFLPILHDSPNR